MRHTIPAGPTLHRSVAVLVASTAAGAALWLTPSTAPPLDVAGALDWWTQEGTAAATMTIVRVVGLASAGWSIALASFGVVVSASRSSAASQIWAVVAPSSFRRLLATSVLVGVTATSTVSGAADPPAFAPPVLIDLGDARSPEPPEGPPPVLVDLGPTLEDEPAQAEPVEADTGNNHTPPDTAAGLPTAETPGNPVESWTVARGDHLWRVAQETLEDRGAAATDGDVARYWRRLIETNRELIGDDPDLIHPGLVLRLPD